MPPVSAGRATRVAQLLGMAPAPPPPGRIPAMLAARRGMIDRVLSDLFPPQTLSRSPAAEALVTETQLPGAKSQWSLAPAERVGFRIQEADGAFRRGSAAGMFGPTSLDLADVSSMKAAQAIDALNHGGVLGVVSYPRGDRGTRRHEVMHGYNEAARQGYEGMPFWSRMAARAPDAIARPLDELVARRAGGDSFMDIPWGTYAGNYADAGQVGAARVARGLHAAQKAGQFASDTAPYLAAGAVGTGILAYGLSQEEEDRAALEQVLRARRPGGMALSAGGVMAGTNSLEE